MIKFDNLKQDAPYMLFKEKYDEALKADQKNIEAISISSFNKKIMKSIVDTSILSLLIMMNSFFLVIIIPQKHPPFTRIIK